MTKSRCSSDLLLDGLAALQNWLCEVILVILEVLIAFVKGTLFPNTGNWCESAINKSFGLTIALYKKFWVAIREKGLFVETSPLPL